MPLRMKSLIKRVLPESVLRARRQLLHRLHALELPTTRRIFAAAAEEPAYLGIDALESLQRRAPPPPEYGYDAHSVEVRGIERGRQILGLPGAQEAGSFLELGCGDGMVSSFLCRAGKTATAIDASVERLDERASRQGVRLLQMDATDLQFADGSFDFVFSYDALEHFASPDKVLREAIRVVRNQGSIYFQSGPLYYSPFGEHAYHSVRVPYCQILFEKSVIDQFTSREGLSPIDFSHVNGWSLEAYRELWSRYSHVVEKRSYHEDLNLAHLDLIRTYPSCFKSKSNIFDNFVVAILRALFEKTG